MVKASPLASRPRVHLRALVGALLLCAVVVVGALPLLRRTELRYMHDLMRKPYAEKNQGLFVQREAFLRDDVLSAYGSSELRLHMKNRADDFFRNAPTGFQVCPVGAAGNTSLLMAEKIAALGSATRGKKVVLLVSYTWFRRPAVPPDHYAGNFSPYQAMSILTSPDLTDAMIERIAARMKDYPGSYASEPALAGYLRAMTGKGLLPGLTKKTCRLAMRAQMAIFDWEDHFGSCCTLLSHGAVEGERWRPDPQEIDWERLAPRSPPRPAVVVTPTDATDGAADAGARDDEFVASMVNSVEWADLSLLLDLLNSQGVKAIVINMPLRGVFDDAHGISSRARDYYYSRLLAICRRHHCPVEDFHEHDHDGDFTVGTSTHPTAKGWLHIDRVIDDFYHDRTLRPAKTRPRS